MRILIAEDQPVNQLIVSEMLNILGFAHELVEDGAEAVEACQREPFDLVLMDVEMPRMDGREATRIIREAGRSIRIVGLTAHRLEEEIQRCLEAGMDEVLPKPIELDALRAVLVSAGSKGP